MNQVVVVDASVTGAWLLPDEHSTEAVSLLESASSETIQLAVPDIWTYEMTNLLVSAYRRNRIQLEQIAEGLRLTVAVPIAYFDHRNELASSRIASIAITHSLSAYDAAYIELADRLKVPVKSFDHRINEVARELGLSNS
jgi:predicted nucleic acid-binding protein